jgi:heterodisulfide reductase subunit B
MMLSCKEATRLASQGLDRRLGLAERIGLRLHLAICSGCAHFARQVEFLRKAVARLAERPPPS